MAEFTATQAADMLNERAQWLRDNGRDLEASEVWRCAAAILRRKRGVTAFLDWSKTPAEGPYSYPMVVDKTISATVDTRTGETRVQRPSGGSVSAGEPYPYVEVKDEPICGFKDTVMGVVYVCVQEPGHGGGHSPINKPTMPQGATGADLPDFPNTYDHQPVYGEFGHREVKL